MIMISWAVCTGQRRCPDNRALGKGGSTVNLPSVAQLFYTMASHIPL